MSDNNYYSKVVKQLLKYKVYKQRVKLIEYEKDEVPLANMGMDYSGVSVSTGGNSDATGQKAINIIENYEGDDEYIEKKKLVKRVEIAFAGLSPIEKFIIRNKYLEGRKKEDVRIYNSPEFDYKKTKYYEIKDEAVKKMAEIMGLISDKKS